MALSDDQRAMLRLLAQREQGYDDIAALMGLSVEQVRAKVREALAEIESEGAPTPPLPPPPPATEPVEPPVAPEPPPPTPVEQPAVAAEPPPPTPAPTPPAAASKPAASSPSPSKLSLPAGRRRMVEWIGGAVIVVLVILFATGTINLGGGSDSSTTTTSTTATESGEAGTTAAESKKITKAVLAPVDGGDAKGLALFGQLKGKIVLQVEAVGLDPSPAGSSYTIWLFKSPKLALRIGAAKVTKSGGLAVRMELPEEAFAAVATRVFDQIDVSLTSDAAYRAEVARAKKANELPRYTGTDVLRGPITGPVIKNPAGQG